MKNIVFILAVVGIMSCAALQAAPSFTAQNITLPNIAAAATSNSLNVVMDVRKQNTVTLGLTSSSTNVLLRIATSVDGSRFNTNALIITFDNNGSASKTVNTNISTVGIGFLRIDSATSVGSIAATNTAYYGIKTEL